MSFKIAYEHVLSTKKIYLLHKKAEIRDKDGRQRKRKKRTRTRERREQGQWRGIRIICHRGTEQRIASG